MGRPSTYTPELAELICLRMRECGGNLSAVCRADDMPSRWPIIEWTEKYPDFGIKYAHARKAGYELMADDITDISDDGSNDWMQRENRAGRMVTVPDQEHIQRSRLRVDTRKWLLSKVLPKIYGDKLALEHTGSLTLSERIRASRERVAPPSDDDDLDGIG